MDGNRCIRADGVHGATRPAPPAESKSEEAIDGTTQVSARTRNERYREPHAGVDREVALSFLRNPRREDYVRLPWALLPPLHYLILAQRRRRPPLRQRCGLHRSPATARSTRLEDKDVNRAHSTQSGPAASPRPSSSPGSMVVLMRWKTTSRSSATRR